MSARHAAGARAHLEEVAQAIERRRRWAVAVRTTSLVLWIAAAAALLLMGPCARRDARGAIWQKIAWTNPPQTIDAVRARKVRAPGDTVAMVIYGDTSTLAVKTPGIPGQRDSAYVSLSTANVVGPAALRFIVETHDGAGWSEPSNALSLFYAARDTFYLGPPLEAPAWSRGPGVLAYAQEVGDARWVDWRHAEVVQAAERARLCLIYGYADRRGARDTAWCAQ